MRQLAGVIWGPLRAKLGGLAILAAVVIIGAPIVAVLWGIGWMTRTFGLPMDVMVPLGLVVGFGMLAVAMAAFGYYVIDW